MSSRRRPSARRQRLAAVETQSARRHLHACSATGPQRLPPGLSAAGGGPSSGRPQQRVEGEVTSTESGHSTLPGLPGLPDLLRSAFPLELLSSYWLSIRQPPSDWLAESAAAAVQEAAGGAASQSSHLPISQAAPVSISRICASLLTP